MKGPGKGNTNNPSGKPKGTLNRTTKESKEFLKQILFAEFDNIQESLKNARSESDSKYIDLLSKLLQFVMPKQIEGEHSGKIDIHVVYGNKRGSDSSLT
jgi:hypothetical protein